MSILDVVIAFSNGATSGSASGKRVRIEGDKLINYNTVIAVRTAEGVRLNARKYSSTTSRLQSKIRAYCDVVEEYEGEDATIYYFGW